MMILRATIVYPSHSSTKIRAGMYWKGACEGWTSDPSEAAQLSESEANRRKDLMFNLGVIVKIAPARCPQGTPAVLRCIKLSPDCDEVVFAFGNERYQTVRFRPDITATDVVKALRDLANRIENDKECYDVRHTDS